jgi:hypothetical protein
MSDKPKIRMLPNQEQDELLAAVEELTRFMPHKAKLAKTMLDELESAGMDHDDALKLVAYSIFRGD